MTIRRLATKYLVAGALLAFTTVAAAAWSAYLFYRLGSVVGATLSDTERAQDATARLASSIEREDDALLLALSSTSHRELDRARAEADAALDGLDLSMSAQDAKARRSRLARALTEYRAASDRLLSAPGPSGGLSSYHTDVNPRLRRAIGECASMREENFRAMQAAGVLARNEATRSTWVVALVAVVALSVSLVVSANLTRTVVRPITILTRSLDALRRGDLDARVRVESDDELGRLGLEFNRMAEALSAFQTSNLGEVLRAKTTLESTLAALPDAVLVVDRDGRTVVMNAPARRLLGLTPGEEVGVRTEQLELPDAARDVLTRALAGSRASSPEKKGLRDVVTVHDGDVRKRVLPVCVPVDDPTGAHLGAVLVLEDVTEFVRLDELRSEVVAIASHELRTPVTKLLMNLHLLGERSEGLDGAQREMLATAVRGCGELTQLLERFLDITRIEAGQLRLVREPVDVCALVRSVVERARPRFDDAGLTLRFEDPPTSFAELVRRVSVDELRLASVVDNLLSNAFKYTPSGGTVTLRLAAEGSTSAPGLSLTVDDDGPGIPGDLRERVFEKFFRVEHERAEHGGVRGAGLGLYLSRQIVEAHGGTLVARAAPSGGAELRMHLPIV